MMPWKIRQIIVFMNVIRKNAIYFPELVKAKRRSFKAFITCHDKWQILLNLPSPRDIHRWFDKFISQSQSHDTFQTYKAEGEDHSLDCQTDEQLRFFSKFLVLSIATADPGDCCSHMDAPRKEELWVPFLPTPAPIAQAKGCSSSCRAAPSKSQLHFNIGTETNIVSTAKN